jgi:hypothetical protein
VYGLHTLWPGSQGTKAFAGEARQTFSMEGQEHEVVMPIKGAAILEDVVVDEELRGVVISAFDAAITVDSETVEPGDSVLLGYSRVDLDMDGDVDGFDFLTFSNCYNGSNKAPLPECENGSADLDNDGDVDGFDFLSFSNCYNGSNKPPRCP